MRFLFRNFWRARKLSLVLSELYQFTLSLLLDSFQFTFGTLPLSYREPDYLFDFIHCTNNFIITIISKLFVNPNSLGILLQGNCLKQYPHQNQTSSFLILFGKLPFHYCEASLTTKIYSSIKNLPFVRLSVRKGDKVTSYKKKGTVWRARKEPRASSERYQRTPSPRLLDSYQHTLGTPPSSYREPLQRVMLLMSKCLSVFQ